MASALPGGARASDLAVAEGEIIGLTAQRRRPITFFNCLVLRYGPDHGALFCSRSST